MNKSLKLGLGAVLAVVVIALAVTFVKAAGLLHGPAASTASTIPTKEEFVKGVIQTCMAGRSDDAKLTAFCGCVGKNLGGSLTEEDMIATKGNSLPPQVQAKINTAESACVSSKS